MMTNFRYDYAIFIGRFQPFHQGHAFVCQRALSQAKKLIILVGSSGNARSLRNPFTFEERQQIINDSLPPELAKRVIIQPLLDYKYNDKAWTKAVSQQIKTRTNPTDHVALVGHNKDESTYYLALFPEWGFLEVGNLKDIHATDLRNRYFACENPAHFHHPAISATTQQWLQQFSLTDYYQSLQSTYHAIQAFKSEWQQTPYPVIFTTVDALVTYQGQALLIRRRNHPGKGLYALPGGFLDGDETLINGALRELFEETQITLNKKTLLARLKNHAVFDDPNRSVRGRTITYCYHFDLSDLEAIPSVCANDDAAETHWLPITTLKRDQFFEDHYFIIQFLLARTHTAEPTT
ncbi:bifunctional nicotinamide-nucleotide adenylyltransferase/Nudix hydroxylase [Ostreibacterium oceani]|uniref:NUDIX domain-containing protein n=1 Tax=Ostreibacterium oceani TaxID=2654998 RepID=A0A6N7ERN8_9GAMM|nr:bifunctional nicotinamide-nucleotide adenylyltransferase/Nudix hydroxylase [Ostreibacterium oceani]MPV85152.1 NUDIX domain-containing protein [Ostreibacterium oceani]